MPGPHVVPVPGDAALPREVDVVVIGGGIVGSSTALELAERGLRVALCEKGGIGQEQSSRNWGWVRISRRDPREVLEAYGSKHRDKAAARTLPRTLMTRHGRPEEPGTDRRRACGAALKEFGAEPRQVTGRWRHSRAETSHPPLRRRERATPRIRRQHSLRLRRDGAA